MLQRIIFFFFVVHVSGVDVEKAAAVAVNSSHKHNEGQVDLRQFVKKRGESYHLMIEAQANLTLDKNAFQNMSDLNLKVGRVIEQLSFIQAWLIYI